jgi:hypothetical protein
MLKLKGGIICTHLKLYAFIWFISLTTDKMVLGLASAMERTTN